MKRILVCGDAMSDVYWRGTVSRISPEAPVPVVAVSSTERREGAAANVANNIEAMGVPVERLFGRGQRIQKIRLVATQHVVRADFDYPQEPILPDETFQEALGRCQIVVFSDYGKGTLSAIGALLAACTQAGAATLIDPKGHDYGPYRGATLIKPNKEEMRELVGGWATQEELDFKARQFLLASGIGSILLTQALEGMTLYGRTETIHAPAENMAPLDVSGAGEAALSAYAAGLARGLGAADCLKAASRAAGIAVGCQGTVMVSAEELWNS